MEITTRLLLLSRRTTRSSAFFNGMDFRLATYTGGPTYVPDHLGVLRSPGANKPACQGFRLEGTTYVNTDESGNAILPSTPQKTVTYNTDWTAKTFAEIFEKFDISDPLKAPGWLCEPVRTNYIIYSVDPTNASWTKDHLAISTSQDVYAPDGTPAPLLTVNATGTTAYLKSAGFTLAVGVYTASRYVKAGSARYCTLGLYTMADAYFDLQGLTTSFSGIGAVSATIESIDDGWLVISATWSITVSKPYSVFFAVANSMSTQVNVLGTTLYSWGHQLELGAFKTSHIYTTTAPMVRAATIASFPTAGKIPVNNFAIRMIVVPRASGQSGIYCFGSYVDSSNYTAIIVNSTSITFMKRVANVDTDASVSITHANKIPLDFILYSSSLAGMQVSARAFSFSSSWGAFTDGTANDTEAAQANAPIASTDQLGSLNGSSQFTGNISLFDCVPIPSGITDPMEWAKTHWGVA